MATSSDAIWAASSARAGPELPNAALANAQPSPAIAARRLIACASL